MVDVARVAMLDRGRALEELNRAFEEKWQIIDTLENARLLQ